MNATRLDILRIIAAKPSTVDNLAACRIGLWAHLSKTTIYLYVSAMATAGYLERKGKVYSATDKARSLLAGEVEPMAGRICNASIREVYTVPKWESARPGADQHQQYRSRGV